MSTKSTDDSISSTSHGLSIELTTEQRNHLFLGLKKCFNLAGLDELCFVIGVEYEDIPGSTKGVRAREIIRYFERIGQEARLLEYCTHVRPNYPWMDVFEPKKTKNSNLPTKLTSQKTDEAILQTEDISLLPLIEPLSPTIKEIEQTDGQDIAKPVREVLFEQHVVQKELTSLHIYLEAGDWDNADRLTSKILLTIVGRQESGWIKSEDFRQLPCQLLSIIDKLWTSQSESEFGFTAQRIVWRKVWHEIDRGLTSFDGPALREFGNEVGWRENKRWLKELHQAKDIRKGFFPTLRTSKLNRRPNWHTTWLLQLKGIFTRVDECFPEK